MLSAIQLDGQFSFRDSEVDDETIHGMLTSDFPRQTDLPQTTPKETFDVRRLTAQTTGVAGNRANPDHIVSMEDSEALLPFAPHPPRFASLLAYFQ